MRILDLFCGAGGAGMGYKMAGFDVIGIDNRPQKHYPFDFAQKDSLEVLRETVYIHRFDAIHASPPCQAYSVLRHAAETKGKDKPDLVGPVRELLEESGLPYIIENVEGAPLKDPIKLCGSMFGLGCICEDKIERQLRRHRLFESNFIIPQPKCEHKGFAIGVYGGGRAPRWTFGNGACNDKYNRRGGYQGTIKEKREAMGIDWMNGAEINQAIPPAYTYYLGYVLKEYLTNSDGYAMMMK